MAGSSPGAYRGRAQSAVSTSRAESARSDQHVHERILMTRQPGTYATFQTTEGSIVVRLFDGTIFHRVIPDFMIQGGDPAGTGMGGPGYQFEDETRGSAHKFDKKGKLAMANAGPNTNGSQFFITVASTTWLTGKHTIFGEVIEGEDIVDKIANAPRGRQDRPVKDIVLQSVTIERV